MCGRFALFSPPETLVQHFGLAEVPQIAPRYNIAPSQPIAIIRLDPSGSRWLSLAHWGLIPSWSEEPKTGFSTFNARAETVAVKPAFRQAFRQRRCLVPADGYYEWQQTGDRHKQPYFIHRQDHAPLAFAGLWELWERGGQAIESCTIIVTDANATTRAIHERMPVVLAPGDYARWLAPIPGRVDQDLLASCPADWLACRPVSNRVGNPRNDDPQCVQAI